MQKNLKNCAKLQDLIGSGAPIGIKLGLQL